MQFFKYVALGNDFILLDWLDLTLSEVEANLSSASWALQVQNYCDRKLGIGADGVLIVYQSTGQIQGRVFNQDGSYGNFSGNGVRSIAHYLHHHRSYCSRFTIQMGKTLVNCQVDQKVITLISTGNYLGICDINVEGNWQAHRMDIGNPHAIIFSQIESDWLKQHGHTFEYYFGQNARTNVEFVWQIAPHQYQMLIHERGVGFSLACGSGAMATTQALHTIGEVQTDEIVSIKMPGGVVQSWITVDSQIALSADAIFVFKGDFL